MFSDKINVNAKRNYIHLFNDNSDYFYSEEYIINEMDFKLALNNLKNIDVYILELLDTKRLFKKLNVKIFFDYFHENKSLKKNIFLKEEMDKIKSVCEYDIKIYEYFKNNNLSNKY